MLYVRGKQKYYIAQPGDGDPLTEEEADAVIAAYIATNPEANPRKMIQKLNTNPSVIAWLETLGAVTAGRLMSTATAAGVTGDLSEFKAMLVTINNASAIPVNVIAAVTQAATDNAVNLELSL